VTGRSPKCFQAIENLRLVCEQYLQGRYHIDVVDLLDNPRLAAYDQILAVPTAGDAGLITHLINDGADVVIVLDITWAD
jgi:hypothetical protein